jgi:CheY-like chemotaxis protein
VLTRSSCGPYKLSVVINASLHKYDSAKSPGTPKSSTSPTTAAQIALKTPSNSFSQFRPRLGLYPPSLAIRTKSSTTTEQLEGPVDEAQPPAPADDPATEESNNKVKVEQALIVDDNAINRRLLSAWMKKHKIAFKEAKDGQQALDLYKEAKGAFDLVLMDISMPVMDGMTSTRLIREHERENEFTPSHIIALTGLTSASAKLEAWTSGVDDYLSKPVDFKRLESLMDAGRGGEGTGFMKEHGSIA